MTSTVTDYSEYVGKKVILTRKLEDGSADEVEGTVEVANAGGILIKPKGKVQMVLIEGENVEQVVLAPDSAKKLKAKKLKPITLGQARSHLLERHGGTLTEVNSMTEEEAFSFHESLDHDAADLGHVHVAESTAAATEASSDDDSSE
jgi:hypothetical protein